MRCLVCGAEMILTNVVPDDTMEVTGFEHHTFTCSKCEDIEGRLVFTEQGDAGTTRGATCSGIGSTSPPRPLSWISESMRL